MRHGIMRTTTSTHDTYGCLLLHRQCTKERLLSLLGDSTPSLQHNQSPCCNLLHNNRKDSLASRHSFVSRQDPDKEQPLEIALENYRRLVQGLDQEPLHAFRLPDTMTSVAIHKLVLSPRALSHVNASISSSFFG